ncbi:PspC domain-containing protein [Plantactinospora sonchi]|uniref:PspC domain-containing protein n=1 Tax=Plantactinospora sonchi TaxID=1544735 RepID=A0ABU7S3C8_9ACTN
MTDDAAAARGRPRPEGGPEHPDDQDTMPLTPPAAPRPDSETPPGSVSGPGAYAASGTGADPYAASGTGDPAATGWPPPGSDRNPPPDPGRTPPGAFTYRYGLVRPTEGRYLAGVCAAIGRATNSDPILWRVLLAVLGFFGGIGILVYVAAWLIIPSEGDSASPVESMLGRGRSSMSPVTVLVLGILVAVMFGFIVTDPYRAVLLGLAVLIGGALLLNRHPDRSGPGHAPPEGGAGPYPPQPPYPVPGYPPAAPVPPVAPAGSGQPGWVGAPAGAPGWPPPAPPVPGWPASQVPAPAWSAGQVPAAVRLPGPVSGAPVAPPVPPTGQQPPFVPPSRGSGLPPAGPATPSGYRPPFAPHGPYAGSGVGPVPPARAPKAPKKPRERSALGAATFSLIFVAIGLVAILDLTDLVGVSASTYFAAALVTIALGLLVGTWFGRARWLIALGLVAACALGISTVAESSTSRYSNESVVWAPASYSALADSYQTRLGSSTLDLTRVDFTGQEARVRVDVNLGEVRVLLPPEVDVTVRVDVQAGDADVLGRRHGDFGGTTPEVVDLGDDGTGGGQLTLLLTVNAGYAEVTR